MPNEERLIELFADVFDRDDVITFSYEIISDGRYSQYNDEQNKELMGLVQNMWKYAVETNEVSQMRKRINTIIYKALKKNLEK
ncbi:hypothetical protein SY212_03210 [Ligilactobacillus agilis]|uniref:Uncharacterized protein n=2 Tax=Ligilactobacillus agilis TaxID=1601 RepID=A0A6F9XJ49_9LACO|nr:hypothetical protein SY212_03210 [Ligilactobacillus agilis]